MKGASAMRSDLKYHRLPKSALMWIIIAIMLFLVSANTVSASCMDLADIPLDTQVQSAPGMIMFLIDDSGSMDWTFVTQEAEGKFNGRSYLYQNPGDHVYLTGSNSYIQEGSTYAMDWKGRWAGYNRLYYNPDSIYTPWPKWHLMSGTDAPTWADSDWTSGYDMDPENPRSNPVKSGYTLNMDTVYHDFSGISTSDVQNAGGVIVDNSDILPSAEIIIDNQDDGFSYTGPWSQYDNTSAQYGPSSPGYWYTNTVNQQYTATWSFNSLETGDYDVYVWYVATDTRGTSIAYTINHSSGTATATVNQRNNGSQWVLIGSDVHFDGSGSVVLDHYCTSTSTDRASADAVKLVPKFSTTLPDAVFQAGSGWSSAADGNQYGTDYLYSSAGSQTYTATWTGNNLDTSQAYDVYARWAGGGTSRLTNVSYFITHDGGVTQTVVNQRNDHGVWIRISESVHFSTGTGVVNINQLAGTSGLCADAVAFVPTGMVGPINIGRAHYYVHNAAGTFLINLYGGTIGYYRVNDENANNRVDAGELESLTYDEATGVGIVTGRTYLEERVNFANWYSFYRKRELTAKNAIANVINTMQGVYIGMLTIHERIQQPAVPVNVDLEGTIYDQTDHLLNTLYGLDSGSGTPLRLGLKKIGRYFQGDYMKPATLPNFTNNDSYPYFIPDKGGSCQQAFCIVMTDGYWNGDSPGVGDVDGDGYSNTLADVAMYYYENDLNTFLSDDVPIKSPDLANHQHMVTYGLSFGVSGTINPEDYPNCKEPDGDCPAWPNPGAGDKQKIDDLFHASVNGRGQYFNANSPEELAIALEEMKQNIESRLGSAASVATNTIQRQVGAMIYQGIYNTDYWSGDVKAMAINLQSGDIGNQLWSAKSKLETTGWNNRLISTYNGTNGVPFRYANLTDAQKVLLNSDQNLLNYLRGDVTNDTLNGGAFRVRGGKLGDVVHSAPAYHRGVVYIGANDGMLHAFNAENGSELFAYVPNLLFDNLAQLAQVGYSHMFYVDGTPYIRNVDGQDILVCGLRKGGKGYFGLNVTDAASISSENDLADSVLWEYPASTDNDMGYSYSQPFIVKTQSAGWVVIFGNGYDSVNEEAILYVLNVQTGAVIKKIRTYATGCNGLSTPTAIDSNFDGYIDYIYAGDLRGNLWKFDLSGDILQWDVVYKDGTNPKPLFQAKNADGEEQPITVAPDVMKHCDPLLGGYIVVFGTGVYLGSDDFYDERTHTLYGIWDWSNIQWPEGVDGNQMYLGFLTAGTDRKLSNSNLPVSFDGEELTLLQQTVEHDTSEWRVLTANDINYYNPADGSGTHAGWYFDLPDYRERSIRDPLIRQGVASMISSVPSDSPCAAGGSSIFYQIDACSGGRTYAPQFDVDGDDKIEWDDIINIGDDNFVPASGKKYNQMIFEPAFISDRIYINDATGNIHNEPGVEERMGMFYWRVID